MSEPGQKNWAEGSGKALVLHPDARRRGEQRRPPEACLEEAVGLAVAIGLKVADAQVVSLGRVRPATLIGSGHVETIATRVAAEEIEVVIMDGALTPGQQRNLERAWHCKVIDRTGLILEIFADRARTREGRLQVELAQLTYQRSRLVRSWTHLERQRGGLGAVGGPGETQIEADRRMIDERVVKLKRELTEVVRTRDLHRKQRKAAPFPVVALVGYTNAGKSTLFNRLTSSDVFAEDQLFATLDPTMRGLVLPSGRKVILSDTVGFISDLPAHLIAAFRATLEEVLDAALILHVRDAVHPDSEAQKQDVHDVLRDLGVDPDDAGDRGIIEVLNKIDLIAAEERSALTQRSERQPLTVAVSAVSGEGIPELLASIDALFARQAHVFTVSVPANDGATLAWLHRRGQVLGQENGEDDVIRLTVRLDDADVGRLRKRLPAGDMVAEAAQ